MESRYDLLVIGGGLAGLLLGHALLKTKFRFSLLEQADKIPGGASAKTKGIVGAFAMDNPARLKKGLGKGKAEELIEFFRSNNWRWQSLLRDFQISYRRGLWIVPASSLEEEELQETAQMLKDIAEWRRGSPVAGEPEGLYLKQGMCFDLTRVIQALARELEPYIHYGAQVVRIERDQVTRVCTSGGSFQAEVVVLCLNAYTVRLFPEWKKFFYPLRAQSFLAEGRACDLPVITNFGHEIYVPQVQNTWMGGINPSSTFEDLTFDEKVTSTFQGFMEHFFEQRFGRKPSVMQRDAGIVCFTPTGLPFIGPLPGRIDLLLFGGFCARGLEFAAQGAHVLVHLLEKGEYMCPSLLKPSRAFGSASPVGLFLV